MAAVVPWRMRSHRFFDQLYLFWQKTRRGHIWLWLATHIAVAVVFFALPAIKVNTELAAVLPASSADASIAEADRRFSQSTAGGFYVLVGNRDFTQAKAAALAFYAAIRNHGGLASASVLVDDSLLQSFKQYLFQNRYRLLPAETLGRLKAGDADSIGMEAIEALTSPVSLGGLDYLDRDPWLLTNRSLQAFLGSGLVGNMAVSLKDGVLAAQNSGVWYVLVNGRTSQSGVATSDQDHIVAAMRAAADKIRAQTPGTDFVWSGVAFHSYDSAMRAQREIGLITSIAMAATIVLLLLTFLSLLPLVSTLATMGIGVAFGMAATFICFREVHIFTIVFGASIIGISLDYSLYYFSERLNPVGPHDGRSIVKRCLPGICLALITTLLSYGAFFLVQFPLLQQMAVFSAMGLVSTFLTVTLLYPYFKAPRRLRPGYALVFAQFLLRVHAGFWKIPLWGRSLIFGGLAIFVLAGLVLLKPNNDIRSLYTMSAEMAQSEKSAAAILRHGAGGQYFLVGGDSIEQVLQREEALAQKLDEGIVQGRLGAWAGTSLLLPSRQRQDQSYRLVSQVLMPKLEAQLGLLDFPAGEALRIRQEYQAESQHYQDLDSYLALPIANLTRTLWVGQIGQQWYSAVLVLKVTDSAWLRGLSSLEGVHYFNKVADINATFAGLSNTAIIILLIAYTLIFVGLICLYGFKSAARLFSIPLIASLATLGILGWLGINCTLFVVMGLIMVPGIGSDYALFFQESSSQKVVTMLAVFECMFGTCMSFGSLGFSALAGSFGITVALGVGISFILAPFILPRDQMAELPSQSYK